MYLYTIKILHTIAWLLMFFNFYFWLKSGGKSPFYSCSQQISVWQKIEKFRYDVGLMGLIGLLIELVILWLPN